MIGIKQETEHTFLLLHFQSSDHEQHKLKWSSGHHHNGFSGKFLLQDLTFQRECFSDFQNNRLLVVKNKLFNQHFRSPFLADKVANAGKDLIKNYHFQKTLDKEEESAVISFHSLCKLYSQLWDHLLRKECRPFEYLGKRGGFHLLALNFLSKFLQKHLHQKNKEKNLSKRKDQFFKQPSLNHVYQITRPNP